MIENLTIKLNNNIRGALQVIDNNSQGVCFVVDQNGKLCGLITDGDIRRGFLRGASMETPVEEVMVVDHLFLPSTTEAEIIQSHLDKKIKIIPLVDESGRPVDYATHFRNHAIPSAEPALEGNELEYVAECLNTNWISSQGRFVKKFENEFAEYLKMPNAVAVSSGTTALHLALIALGVGPGDEVIVPNLTFAASASTIVQAGAEPVLVDVCRDDWCIEPEAIVGAITKKTRAILPVHLYGQPAKMDEITEIAIKNNLLVVEDCAQALGSSYYGKMPGSFGDAGTFSFFGNKLLTTGEGGMIVFKDKKVAEKARRLRDHGMSQKKRYWHEEIGYNYRLTNIQAAIGVAQLERIDSIVKRKLDLSSQYRKALSGIPQIELPCDRDGIKNTYWMFSILLNTNQSSISLDEFEHRLNLRGIDTRRIFYPLHQMPPYREFSGKRLFPNTEKISMTILNLYSNSLEILELQN